MVMNHFLKSKRFCSVADLRMISLKLRQLGMLEPSIMSIKALEKELDVELFVRSGNHVELSGNEQSHL